MSDARAAETGYRRRRRRRRRLVLAGAALAAVLVVVTARRPDLDDPCDAPRPAPAAELALMPAGLSLAGIATVTDVRQDGANVAIRAVTTTPPEEVAFELQEAVVAAGYRPAGAESEGTEAEVFFQRGQFAGGQARIQQAACAGRFDVDLVLLDPDAVPGATTPTGTVP